MRINHVKKRYNSLLFQIEYSKVAAVLDKDQLTFPDNPTVWLMDLATFINCSFDNIPEPDPVFENKPRGRVGYIFYN